LFFHDTVDSLQENLVLFHFFGIDIEELGSLEIVTGSVEIFIGNMYFNKILEAFCGEIFVGIVLETF
jgi:hypothetical protein